MDFVGRALIAVDRHLHTEDDTQEFSERLFFNIGRFYSYGMLFGGIQGLAHRAKSKTQVLDAISDHAWRSSLSAASAAFLYTPLETTLRKQAFLSRPYSEDVAWGAAWALTRRAMDVRRRLVLGCAVGLGHSALRLYGPMLASTYCNGKKIAQLWTWRLRTLDSIRETTRRLMSKDQTAEECLPSEKSSEEVAVIL